MRLFIAIPLHLAGIKSDLIPRFQKALPRESISWSKPENLHQTLIFLGETPENLIPQIMDIMDAVAYDFDPFMLTVEDTGIFGSSYDPKVIWAGVQPVALLTEIHNALSNALQEVGYKPDRQNFVPHLTVGRVRKKPDKKRLQTIMEKTAGVTFYTQNVDELVLFESKLAPQGAEYTIKGVSTLGC